ncbi:glycosyltransferase [Halopseudomonas aestusnigri]|uniref:glycosyltransferase family 2 protein n=1 Tax=Halopseudomonas aestusnigri TaxID=857252 RepID=UPI001E33CF7B|nr:glycosyltransferase [Halopseudomonas aestusnigri]UGV31816.1 glycosyltransferase [Halopseudomonas aestusnigri]
MHKSFGFDLDEFRELPLPSQDEIMSNWHGHSVAPLVSVLCATYNHRPYIEDAIKGFLLQKTSFPFEIVIHDDCSSDGTLEVLLDFKNRYPCIIRIIAQTENQYSRGYRPIPTASSFALGKYLAICEGDDFWIDSLKLECQKNQLEANPDVSMCFHNAYRLNARVGTVDLFNKLDFPKTIRPRDIVLKGWFSPTASFFLRKSVMDNVSRSLSDGANGDMLILLESSLAGSVVYDSDVRSVYRYLSSGSMSVTSSYRELVDKKVSFYKVVLEKKKSLFFYVFFKVMYYKLMIAKRAIFDAS